MTISKKVYREHSFRLHRVLAFYLATKAWMAGKLGVMITDNVLRRSLGVTKLKDERVLWLTLDMKDWFTVQRYPSGNGEIIRMRGLWAKTSISDEDYFWVEEVLTEAKCVSELIPLLAGHGNVPKIAPSVEREIKRVPVKKFAKPRRRP